MGERCLLGSLPEFGTAFGGSYRRIVQTPGGITFLTRVKDKDSNATSS